MGEDPAPVLDSEEKMWAILAHISIWVNLITGLLGVLAALVVYTLYREKSKYVAYHAWQAFIFQISFWVMPIVLMTWMWLLTSVLSLMFIGLIFMPFAAIVTIFLVLVMIASLIYSVVAAVKLNQGEEFGYWWVVDLKTVADKRMQ